MPIDEHHADFVTAFARGLAVIRTFEHGADRLTLSQVAARTNLTRGSARRFLLTLEALGYVTQDGNSFRLSPKVLDLGYSYLSSLPLWEKAQPFMKEIVDTIDESCSLGVLDEGEVVYIARVPPRHIYTIHMQVGSRMPAYVNAMGRVLLAALGDAELEDYFAALQPKKLTPRTITSVAEIRRIVNETRDKGYVITEDEVYEGRRSVAVPIRNREGQAIASINISAMDSRANRETFEKKFLPLLSNAAQQIGQSL
ncbi:IclR family transcriptional regulator C-terminal domain-containing protein [Paraburkholderia phymatum]|uniref:IclR family transcriptional regulator C-terminal domain-containing protein n=1 Tax=Paraburkholderia phymatum TaxID=148447 RepID=A0ACC6U8U3_9BURK